MQITDLEYLNLAVQPNLIEGAALAYASSSSIASSGFSSSDFEAIAIGSSSTATSADVKLRTISIPKFVFSSSSASVYSSARD